jgi:hypothetical protein
MFSDDQLEQLRSFPGIGRDDLIRFFMLTSADVAFVDPRPPAAVARLGVDPDVQEEYGRREQTRTDHLRKAPANQATASQATALRQSGIWNC